MSDFKGYRESLGLTRAQLSEEAGVEIGSIWLLENGFEDKVPQEVKEKITKALDRLLLERKAEKLTEENSK